jgi:hypothetical protein
MTVSHDEGRQHPRHEVDDWSGGVTGQVTVVDVATQHKVMVAPDADRVPVSQDRRDLDGANVGEKHVASVPEADQEVHAASIERLESPR